MKKMIQKINAKSVSFTTFIVFLFFSAVNSFAALSTEEQAFFDAVKDKALDILGGTFVVMSIVFAGWIGLDLIKKGVKKGVK